VYNIIIIIIIINNNNNNILRSLKCIVFLLSKKSTKVKKIEHSDCVGNMRHVVLGRFLAIVPYRY